MANGRLEVLLVEAQGIRDRDKCIPGCLNCLNPCNLATKPYVHILYAEQERTSCVAKGKGKKREWNEKFAFEVKYPDGGEDRVYKIIFRVMDQHKFTEDVFVGESTVYVKDILSTGAEKGKLEVQPRLYRVVQSDKTYSGEISVAFTFTKIKDGIEENPEGRKECANQG
ncbi:unnamed protein product [Coffea canephora]|uniref:C2 domain-containing protein n=1 Tax=Coffea canephora TaxID=49390 RepID=A0A068UEB9_COFCA|nr:unnamed protein product [Coffea canephora]